MAREGFAASTPRGREVRLEQIDGMIVLTETTPFTAQDWQQLKARFLSQYGGAIVHDRSIEAPREPRRGAAATSDGAGSSNRAEER